ncbi:MAG TPA: twin-arginine translocase TatA/TatE family subunit [Bacteriovoracaceae bacterium]|nr:twin-arginine translocase TatA/TatE family subunit [Bacteriovoracaceae bacterium]
MFGLGFGELVLILLIALIFIGPKKLPELAKGLGQGMREFQKAAKELTGQLQDDSTQATPLPPKTEDTSTLADLGSSPGGDAPLISPEPTKDTSKEEKPS